MLINFVKRRRVESWNDVRGGTYRRGITAGSDASDERAVAVGINDDEDGKHDAGANAQWFWRERRVRESWVRDGWYGEENDAVGV